MRPYSGFLQRTIPFFLLIFIIQSACKKEGKNPNYPSGSNEYINDWVMDSMKVYYYWNSILPSNPNLNQQPLQFFSSIKHSGDRFSRLTNPAIRESYYPSLVRNFGFDLAVFRESSGVVKTFVVLVVPGTKAQAIGLQRGDVLKTINETSPSGNNIEGLIESAIAQRSISLDVENKGNITLGAELISENSVYLHKTFDSNAKKVAYLFYNSFEGRSKYDLQEAFADFKSKNATELIIDVRYNPGGDIGVCAALSAAIANVNPSDVFVEYRGNANAGIHRETFGKTISLISPGYSLTFDELSAMRLQLNRVFILTGPHTGSAAEFLIKGLRPWISVIQIGGTTLGKDMASFTIKDNNPEKYNNWSIEPMIFKLYNSRGEGDYNLGLAPDIATDEFSETIVPFGRSDDPLIKSALARINGSSNSDDMATKPAVRRLLYNSRQSIDKNSADVRIDKAVLRNIN
ncbi:S41 family peptidase [Mucilaginibacter defluvii]